MSAYDEHRIHLIERAAARLNHAAVAGAIGQFAPRIAEASAVPPPARDAAPKGQIRSSDNLAINLAVMRRAGLIDSGGGTARIANEMRILQSEILRLAFESSTAAVAQRANMIMITSALPGEGKSFTALNVAAGIARRGDRRVLLIDTDAKPGSLSERLGAAQAPGFLNIADESNPALDNLTLPTAFENLDFLPIGTRRSEAADLLAGNRAAAVIEGIRQRHPASLHLFDAPACLASSEPHALASLVGQVVLVVAAGSTQQSHIEAALDRIRTCADISLLLNKMTAWHALSFGDYGRER